MAEQVAADASGLRQVYKRLHGWYVLNHTVCGLEHTKKCLKADQNVQFAAKCRKTRGYSHLAKPDYGDECGFQMVLALGLISMVVISY